MQDKFNSLEQVRQQLIKAEEILVTQESSNALWWEIRRTKKIIRELRSQLKLAHRNLYGF